MAPSDNARCAGVPHEGKPQEGGFRSYWAATALHMMTVPDFQMGLCLRWMARACVGDMETLNQIGLEDMWKTI
eukprot:CAMPEP_0197457442 /NCGR_PEP_ID=MMETSP1175-20131217/46056_1 /TAXON_ID=1003142 /ORGANISM="Triceratium dubium, Strain CCMP147" /LENGTH=72 /DNA_ID=CAMNT_0042991815 /DNA_START=134 /DNA_END=352 /DNA_ORIENTATION=-